MKKIIDTLDEFVTICGLILSLIFITYLLFFAGKTGSLISNEEWDQR